MKPEITYNYTPRHSRGEQLEALGRVLDTLDILRVHCPWDAKQTNDSLRANTVEETYELAQALLNDNNEEIRKELGDVLLHILFYSRIGDEKGAFDIADVCDALNSKLIFRHPHVFGETKVDDAHQVEQNWEQIKLKEKGGNRSVLAGVPEALPALIKAYRIQEKAANAGFDWEQPEDVWEKVSEEIAEVREAIKGGSKKEIEGEFGDLMFAVINAARLYKVNPENCLELTNRKFIRRFNYIESKAREAGLNPGDMNLEQMEALWQEAKASESPESRS